LFGFAGARQLTTLYAKIVNLNSLAVKSRLLPCLALFLALVPLVTNAAPPSAATRADRLAELVPLTSEQRAKATAVFQHEMDALAALPAVERGLGGMEIRQASREQIRALLTPEQQQKYDRTPQVRGGGLTLPTPENKTARLDETVHLTATQKPVVLQIYQEEFESLIALPPAERPEKGARFRQAAKEQVQAVLTPEQLALQDRLKQAAAAQEAEEKRAVENVLRSSKTISARVGSIVSLSSFSSTVSESTGQSRRGKYDYKVTGKNGSEVVSVSWERTASSGPVKIVKVEASRGEIITP
jgi:hypothetical protein